MYYIASCKSLGKMAAYHKTGRLHPQINEMFPMPGEIREIPKGIPPMDPTAKKGELAKIDQWIRFMSETAAAIYPKEISDKKFLDELRGQISHMMDYQTEIHCYCSGAGTPEPNDWVVFTHNNLQVDNAIFYHNDQNDLEVGMLDWGAMGCGPFVNSIMGGCCSGAQDHIYCEYRDQFNQAAADAYSADGGPKLDVSRMATMDDLRVANWVIGLGKNTSAILKDVKAKDWPSIKSLTDDKIKKSWNAWAWCSQFNNGLIIYQKLDIYNKFKQWIKDNDLPTQKS
mmetsp:Transcript_53731/g.151350  ORF Transcript_53731/g.151350 Transcript_53731/m.151350 type:complete len:284 (+) Transcript_53731:1-852(+)